MSSLDDDEEPTICVDCGYPLDRQSPADCVRDHGSGEW